MALNQLLSLPGAAAGLALTPSTTAWVFGSWVVASASVTTDIYIIGFEWTAEYTSSLDTTIAHLFEIGTGATGSEVTQIQLPGSWRDDTAAGHYFPQGLTVFLPEPYFVPAGAQVSVRVANLVGAATPYRVKIFYREGAPAASTGVPNALMMMGIGI